MVIAVVLLAGLALYMLHGEDGTCCITIPNVTFGSVWKNGTLPYTFVAGWRIEGISESVYSFSSFKVMLAMDGVPLANVSLLLTADSWMTFGNVSVSFHDLVGEGRLTVGDTFFVAGMQGIHAWKFYLFWALDDSVLESVSWNTP